jgi:arabinogalactan oligomer/maltooligosaccharide transport system permease protein
MIKMSVATTETTHKTRKPFSFPEKWAFWKKFACEDHFDNPLDKKVGLFAGFAFLVWILAFVILLFAPANLGTTSVTVKTVTTYYRLSYFTSAGEFFGAYFGGFGAAFARLFSFQDGVGTDLPLLLLLAGLIALFVIALVKTIRSHSTSPLCAVIFLFVLGFSAWHLLWASVSQGYLFNNSVYALGDNNANEGKTYTTLFNYISYYQGEGKNLAFPALFPYILFLISFILDLLGFYWFLPAKKDQISRIGQGGEGFKGPAFISDYIQGSWPTKLSYVFWGFGYCFFGEMSTLIHHFGMAKGQPILNKKGEKITYWRFAWLRVLLLAAIQILVIVLFFNWGLPNLLKMNMEGLSTPRTCTTEFSTKKTVCVDGDNSFKILLFSLIMIAILVAYLVLWIKQPHRVFENEKKVRKAYPIHDAMDDVDDALDSRFYKTVLAAPVFGVILFTIIPILFMVFVAFTNYDATHSYPTNNFNWVGFDNFATFFTGGGTGSYFGEIFGKVLLWTLLWAFFATITTYIGGLLLALQINSKLTKFPKLWRTCFVITIAVPQFVTLMLIRFFLGNNGIINSLLYQWGVVDWAKSIGWISTDYFPFFSDPTWMKVMVIIINMWIGFPYMMLITSGILMNIPSDLYESARIDGAGPQRMFWNITMPYILQVTGPYLISSFVGNLNNFNVIYLLTSGYTSTSTRYASVKANEADLLVTWLFKMVTDSTKNYYMSSVIGIFIFLVSAIFTLLAFTQTTKGNREERFQ